MSETQAIPLAVFGAGALLLAALFVRRGLEKLSLPAVVGFLGLGMLLGGFDSQYRFAHETQLAVLEFLGAIGLVVLLFKVGVESNLKELVKQLPKAGIIWLPNILLSGLPAYFIMRDWLGFDLAPSLFIGVAMTATSVGVSVAVWEEMGAMKSSDGKLLLDTAELDDISGVMLMALLFSLAPMLKAAGEGDAGAGSALEWTPLLRQGGIFLLKLGLFTSALYLLGRYLETFLEKAAGCLGDQASRVIFAFSVGIAIAGLAGIVGLSLPIGALFAGLMLSQHPEKFAIEKFYRALYIFFVPFFFINIGFQIDPSVLGGALGLGGILLAVAILGKLAGTACTAWKFTSATGVLLLGASMVPRAEITMVIIERGRALGDWAMPPEVYAAMVLVSAGTCLGTALFLHWGLRKWRTPTG